MMLNEIDLFSGIGYDVMNEIAEICSEETYIKDTVLFEKDEKAETLYILQEGTLDLIIRDGGSLIYRLNDPGEVFGWSSMVENGRYTASGVCTTDIRAIKIKREKIDAIFHRHPEAGFKVLKQLAGVISKRLSNAYRELVSVR